MKSKIIILILLLFFILQPVSGAQRWCGVQTLFFQNNLLPDIPGYEQLINYPSGETEVDEFVTVQASSGPVLIDTYLTPVGEPGVSEISNGLRRYRTFMYVNSASGITRLNFTPFIRYANGTEKNIYTVMTDDIDSLVVTEYLTSYTNPNVIHMDPTSRFGVRVTANTTQPSNIVVHWVYEGTTHYSSVDSGNFVCEDTPLITNETYQYSPTPATPFSTWLIFAVGGIVLFIMAFLRKLRDEKGGVNKERIVLSLLGGIVNVFAAWLTLVVDIPNDGNHVLYQGGLMIIAFVIMGLLCFAGFVYALLSPEIIENSEDMGEEKKK